MKWKPGTLVSRKCLGMKYERFLCNISDTITFPLSTDEEKFSSLCFFLLSMNRLVGIVAYRPSAVRILASSALVPLTTTSLSFVSLLSGHFLEKRRTRYELRIRICYQKWSSFNLPLHLLLTAWAVVCRWHPALPVTTGINPETVRFNTNSSSEIAQNFDHFKYSLLVNKKNILCEYSSFFKPSIWNYVRLNWINLPRTTLYRNDRYNKTPLCGRAVFAATDFPLHNKA